MRRLPTVTPRQYERLTLYALVLLFIIILTGTAVRLTDSGLGCTNWPRCGESIVAPLELNAWIEFGNRIITGLVGIPCVAAFVMSFRRTPRRKDLIRLSALLPLGVLAQAVLGGMVVLFHLDPRFVMGHFLLSQLILVSAVALYWRARHERGERPVHDRRTVLLTRALLVWGALVLVAGTITTAAGPHPGHNAEDEIVPRLTALGPLDDLIHWHGRSGTVLGLLAVGTWFHARRNGWSPDLRRALTTLCVLVAAQGVIGFAQYELELPAGLVWLHVAVASAAWTSILFANAAAGPLNARPSSERPDRFWADEDRTSVEPAPATPS